MLKRSLLILAVAALCMLAAAPSGSASERTCPAAFETLTIDEAVAIKIALGYPRTPEELEAGLRGADKNGDEVICSGELPDVWFPLYLANIIDNRANVP